MPALEWDKTGERFYETGIDKVTLYPYSMSAYQSGIAWNGVTAITENKTGAEANPIYADNIKYLNLISAEEFGLTIEAYTAPKEFDECDGTAEMVQGVYAGQQSRKMFGLAYRTKVGNDEEGDDHGYQIHLVYGLNAAPSEKAYNTINESPEPATMSWECTTTPVKATGFKPLASLVIDSRYADPEKLATFEETLWGESAKLPMPDEVKTALTPAA